MLVLASWPQQLVELCVSCLPSCTQARKCGIKQFATSSTTLWSCSISGGSHGLVVCGNSQAFLEGCKVHDCGQDGIVVLQQAGLHLSHSSVSSCKGPGVDVSDDGTASLKHVDIKDCCGGVWLWQRSNCEVGGWSIGRLKIWLDDSTVPVH
jgi:hypothetical protein